MVQTKPTPGMNFMKAVNWALRNIGKRNRALNVAAVACARRILAANERAAGDPSARAARWVANDAPQFAHLFADDGYAAGSYGYLWAEVLDHDAYQAFVESENPYDKAMAKKLVDTLFSVGNTVDPAEAYRDFRGRDPKVEALLKARGLDGVSATN
jgi:Zn-dependent oligopeptidase